MKKLFILGLLVLITVCSLIVPTFSLYTSEISLNGGSVVGNNNATDTSQLIKEALNLITSDLKDLSNSHSQYGTKEYAYLSGYLGYYFNSYYYSGGLVVSNNPTFIPTYSPTNDDKNKAVAIITNERLSAILPPNTKFTWRVERFLYSDVMTGGGYKYNIYIALEDIQSKTNGTIISNVVHRQLVYAYSNPVLTQQQLDVVGTAKVQTLNGCRVIGEGTFSPYNA